MAAAKFQKEEVKKYDFPALYRKLLWTDFIMAINFSKEQKKKRHDFSS
jgi:hypothetical protein